MGDLVNLRRARKAKVKSSAEKLAGENRRRFGLTLAEKRLSQAQASIEQRRFAGHLLAEKVVKDDSGNDNLKNGG